MSAIAPQPEAATERPFSAPRDQDFPTRRKEQASSLPLDIDIEQWRQLIVSLDGPATPGVRLVLLALSVRMLEQASTVRITFAEVAALSGIGERTAKNHIYLAERTGWLKRVLARTNGRGWRVYRLSPAVPRRFMHDHVCRGTSEAAP